MRTRNEPESSWKPPRGIRYLPTRDDRAMPFGLSWREGGKLTFKFFKDEGDRETLARKLSEALKERGRAVLSFNAEGWAEFVAAKEIAWGQDLRTVAREWVAGRRPEDMRPPTCISVREAVEKYLALRFAADITETGITGCEYDLHLRRRFGGTFGTMRLDDVTADQIREWISGIKSFFTGKPVSATAQWHHRKNVNTFFRRAVREGWIKKNPCELVDPPKIEAQDVQILTVEQARQLLFANRDQPIAAKLALEMFGGLRCSSVERIKREHIDLKAKGIRMPGGLHKSGASKYRQGQPAICWAWLRAAPETCWTEITASNYKEKKAAAFRRAFGADFRPPKNCLRHSFASYYIAMTGSLQGASYLMQHTDLLTTTIYEGMAKKAEAKKYFSISPSSKK